MNENFIRALRSPFEHVVYDGGRGEKMLWDENMTLLYLPQDGRYKLLLYRDGKLVSLLEVL